MDRIWLKHYPPGVPADIDTTAAPTLVHILEKSFRDFRDRKAVAFMGKTLTYGEIDAASRAFGAFLQGRGLPRGARVHCRHSARRLHRGEHQSALQGP